MKKIWESVFIACLLCQLARRFVCAQETLLTWEGDFGIDMCPECRPLPPLIQTRTPQNLHDEELGVDICPEKGQPMSVRVNRPGPILRTDSNTLEQELQQTVKAQQSQNEEDLGVDMCPEKGQPMAVGGNYPGQIFGTHSNSLEIELQQLEKAPPSQNEEDLGVDMCPEKGQPMAVRGNYPGPILGADSNTLVNELQQLGKAQQSQNEEDFGVDMCPEKGQPMAVGGKYPSQILGTHSNTLKKEFQQSVKAQPSQNEEDLGVDMCPEKGQPMAVGGNYAEPILGTNSNTLVNELQQLLKSQQSQIDQLGDLLQKLGPTGSRVDLGILDLSRKETPGNKDSYARFTHDEFPGHELGDLAETREQHDAFVAGTSEQIASTRREMGMVPVDRDAQGKSSGRAMLVVPYRPSWSEHFSFLSAVKVDGEVSCINVLPQVGAGGDTRYVVGDMKGELYIFLWLGDLLLHYPTISTAPITAMLSYSLQKTETILVTGHADGGVLVHQVRDSTEPGSDNKDGTAKIASFKTLHSLKSPSPQFFRANTVERDNWDEETKASMYSREASESVVNLEMFKVGKMRYTVVVDKSGKIQLFRDNGSLHGVAQAPSQPLAFMRNPNAQRLVFLTEDGVGTLDLRSMQVRSRFCLDLNSSKVMAYAFDAVGRSKANGFTTEGDLVSVVLRGDMLNLECHVKKRRHLEILGPFSPLALKGYLVAATPDHVLVFNATSQTGFNYASIWVEGPRLIFSVPLKRIALSFLKAPISPSHWPVVASNRDRVIVLGFGCGYVGVFRSHLPMKPADFSAKFSNTSILISGLVLLAMWQLLNRKRGAVAVKPPMLSSSTAGDEKTDSARLGLAEREKVVEPRRFKSPTRGYVVANSTPFGSSSRNFMLSDADTYSTSREPLFASNQPVGELEPRKELLSIE